MSSNPEQVVSPSVVVSIDFDDHVRINILSPRDGEYGYRMSRHTARSTPKHRDETEPTPLGRRRPSGEGTTD
jgi:hypothetical protein